MTGKKYITGSQLSAGIIGMLCLFVLMASVSVADAESITVGSNESIHSFVLISEAERCIAEMQNRTINISRANESLQQALQMYSAQITLEEKGKTAQYKLVNQSAVEVCRIKDISLKAQDELILFSRTWDSAGKNINLSPISSTHSDIINSFNDERFEETSALISNGYKVLSDFQSSQAILNLFYKTTTKTIKDFFVENWKILSTSAVIFAVLLGVLWKTIRRVAIKIKLRNLARRKSSIYNLIKKTQSDYFEKKIMSETEYTIKIGVFGEMVKEIDRQLPEIYERLMKLGAKNIGSEKEIRGKKRVRFKK